MFVAMFGSPISGLSFVGPFVDHEAATRYCEGADGPWEVVEVSSPPERHDSIYDILSELGDAFDEVANFLTADQILPCEAGDDLAERLTFYALTCRNPAYPLEAKEESNGDGN